MTNPNPRTLIADLIADKPNAVANNGLSIVRLAQALEAEYDLFMDTANLLVRVYAKKAIA